MEEVLTRENMSRALKRIKENKGAAGVDEMTVEELEPYLKAEWPRIRKELLEGEYKPKAVRRVKIPKPDGGERALGIPTVVDRLIQQAVHQVISPIFERDFSASIRVSAGQERAASRGTSAAVRGTRPAMGRGHRPGEVFRPSKPRHLDGQS